MTPMDGFVTIDIIKSDKNLKDIPVIILTAGPLTPERMSGCDNKIVKDYILKPFTLMSFVIV